MAQGVARLDPEKLSCSICLDFLKEPVTVPCGHNFCTKCIKRYWDEEEYMGFYRCPLCRKKFRHRPEMKKNILLTELVEDLNKNSLQVFAADLCPVEPEDVACDICIGKKLKADKSCLVCLASYCEGHLQTHQTAAPLKKHQLVKPSKNLSDNVCSHHDEVMKIFCRTDQQCICYLCMMEQHRDHETVSIASERDQKQKELEKSLLSIQQRIQEQEKDMKQFLKQMEDISLSADEALEHIKRRFAELICLIQRRSHAVEQQVRSRQQDKESGLKELEEKLEQELAKLKMTDAQLEELAQTEDHFQFLHSYTSVAALSDATLSSDVQIASHRHFEDVVVAVTESIEKILNILEETGNNISLRNTGEFLQPQQWPETREDFLQYSQQITLDPNTANKLLSLSQRNTQATLLLKIRPYNDHPDRFTECVQVLSRESLTGRSYWEVEWKAKRVDVAVTYKSISRKGWEFESGFGSTDKSWALCCDSNGFIFRHNSINTPLSGPLSSRVGVYLDHTAGLLDFYSITETMTLLHRVQTIFIQPVNITHAGIRVYGNYGAFAKLVNPQ